MSLDEQWRDYVAQNTLKGQYSECIEENSPILEVASNQIEDKLCDDYELLISTKTKVLFLNTAVDIHSIFWNIPVIEYWKPEAGIIKKQIKVISKTIEEFNAYQSKLEGITFYRENVIKQINNPLARTIKFKDERKITIGLSKKDILNRCKRKNAFYNCFAIILRFEYNGIFRETHIKVFNTGKMEIPGIVSHDIFTRIKSLILEILQKFFPNYILSFIDNSSLDHVLINSNFNCGFFIHRDSLHNILSIKYEIETSYDPCSYPGIKCKFYFNNEIGFDIEKQNGRILLEDNKLKLSELNDNKKYTEVSFMIFRTGSCLIVGNCSENILRFIFNFIKKILTNEYDKIRVISENAEKGIAKSKVKKLKKKNITISRRYYEKLNTSVT